MLVCQLFGYKTQEETVGGRGKIDFSLADDTTMLDATVVVGYGTLKKAQLVGSVENLSGEAIEDRPNANIARNLQGQVAGLNIIQVDGKASHTGSVYIRGNGTTNYTRTNFNSSASGATRSIGTGGSALVLIDGVEGDLTSVNSADVETVAVLKDASSAAIYGAKGAFGVIMVTTKNAKESEKFTLTYNGTYSYNDRITKWEDHIVTDGLEYTEAFYELYAGDTRTPTSTGKLASTINTFTIGADYLERLRERRIAGNYNVYDMYNGAYAYYGNTDWFSEFYKKGYSSTIQDISLRGATKKITYSLTGRYYTQEGVYKIGEDTYNRFNVRAKAKLQVNDWLSVDNNTSMFRSIHRQPMFTTSSILGYQIQCHAAPVLVPYNEDGTWTLAANKSGFTSFSEGNTGQYDTKMQLVTTTGINIDFIKDVLKFRGDFSYKAVREVKERYRAPMSFSLAPGAFTDYVTQASSYKSRWTYDTDYITANAYFTFTPKLGENHDLDVVAGWNIENYDWERFYLQRKGMLAADMYKSYQMFDGIDYNIQQYDRSYGTMGFFGRINYTLLKRYIFEVSARADACSKFPSNQLWGFFPSASLGWRISEEPWMKWSRSWLDNLKLRANFGSLGNGDIAPYSYLETLEIDKTSIPINGVKVNYTNVPSPIPDSLTWETVTTYDIGLDLDMLRNRLSFSGDIYRRYNSDLLTAGPSLPDIYGASAPKGNYGELTTNGWEATLSWRDSFKLGGKDFQYSIKGSVWDSRTFVSKFLAETGNILTMYKGKEIGEIWGFRTDGYFLNYTEANNWATDTYHKNGSNFREYAGDLKFIDVDGNGTINYGKQSFFWDPKTNETTFDTGDLEVIGNVAPRYQYGVNFDFKWSGIGLSMFFQGVGHRDWYPSCETGLFYGGYNRPYMGVMKTQIGDNYVKINYTNEDGSVNPYWEVTNADKHPYWTRRVGYCANRNVGPLTVENDYYMQNAAYLRLKNLTIDYTLPKDIVKKANIENVKFYVTLENILTWSPMFKVTEAFDPEGGLGLGDTDFDSYSNFGLSGIGQGYGYPMLKSYTFGVNITF